MQRTRCCAWRSAFSRGAAAEAFRRRARGPGRPFEQRAGAHGAHERAGRYRRDQITEIGAKYVGHLGQLRHDIGMRVEHVRRLARIVLHVEERLWRAHPFIGAVGAVLTRRPNRFIRMPKDQLPSPAAQRMKTPIPIVVKGQGTLWIVGDIDIFHHQRPNVHAVDHAIGRDHTAGQRGNRWKHIDDPGRRIHHLSRGDLPRPIHDPRRANAAVEDRPLALAQAARAAGMVAEAQPGPVVRREDHQRVLSQPLGFQRFDKPAHVGVDLLHNVAVQTASRRTFEGLGHRQRHMRQAVGDIKEQRLVGIAAFDV